MVFVLSLSSFQSMQPEGKWKWHWLKMFLQHVMMPRNFNLANTLLLWPKLIDVRRIAALHIMHHASDPKVRIYKVEWIIPKLLLLTHPSFFSDDAGAQLLGGGGVSSGLHKRGAPLRRRSMVDVLNNDNGSESGRSMGTGGSSTFYHFSTKSNSPSKSSSTNHGDSFGVSTGSRSKVRNFWM